MRYSRTITICCLIFGLFILVWGNDALAGITGKIGGKITDKNTGEPLIGANVMIEGTERGAAADVNGNYSILRMPP